jgi:hypothetical protein
MSLLQMKPSAKRAASIVLLFIVAAAIIFTGALYSINRHRQRLAAQMMADAASLKLGAPMSDVLAFAARFDASVSGASKEKPCTQYDCLIVAGVPSEESERQHPKLNGAYDQILRRSWIYVVFIWVKDGKLTGQQQWFTYTTPSRSLAVVTRTSPAFAGLCRHPSYVLHNEYSVETAPHHFNVWADPSAEEGHSIALLDLRCVTALLGCRAVSEMAPAAWQRYERDQRVLEVQSESTIQEARTTCAAAFKAD